MNKNNNKLSDMLGVSEETWNTLCNRARTRIAQLLHQNGRWSKALYCLNKELSEDIAVLPIPEPKKELAKLLLLNFSSRTIAMLDHTTSPHEFSEEAVWTMCLIHATGPAEQPSEHALVFEAMHGEVLN